MRTLMIFTICLFATACSSARVLVQDCQPAGPGIQNCELVKKL